MAGLTGSTLPIFSQMRALMLGISVSQTWIWLWYCFAVRPWLGVPLNAIAAGGQKVFVRLSEKESRSMLAAAGLGRLGCIVDGGPYIVPINYYFEDDCAYSHSLPGLKVAALRENPRACLQVDEIKTDLCWRSVLAFGIYEEIATPGERKSVLGKLLKRFPTLTPVESAIAADAGPPPVIIFCIRIDSITGVGEE
jgi:uncharacterized protein